MDFFLSRFLFIANVIFPSFLLIDDGQLRIAHAHAINCFRCHC